MLRSLLPLLGLSLVAACATGASLVDPDAAGASYYSTLADRLTAAAEPQKHLLRLNPVACGCPAFEVQLAGAWYRVAVEIEADSDESATLRAALAEPGPPGSLRTWRVVGTLDPSPATCGQGALYATLRAVGLAAGADA